MKHSCMIALSMMTLAACSSVPTLDFSGVDPALTVPPTQVMVLGTPHLSGHADIVDLDDLEPLMARLERFAPDIITIENSSGMTCSRVRAYPDEHEGYADSYCFDGSAYRAESELSVAQASLQARRALLDWPEAPTPSQRRALAAAFIASEEPESALVQWLRLESAERVAGEGVGPVSVAFLNHYALSMNESRSIAARLAARLGLERVFPADDHGSWLYTDGERDAYGARITALWPGEGDPCRDVLDRQVGKIKSGALLEAYRDYNSVDSQRMQMSCDWKRTMNDAEPEGYGRRYTAGWQARNLRMVSMIVTAAASDPGGRVLSIVGASHKPYFEAYLDQMHDFEIVSTDTVLD